VPAVIDFAPNGAAGRGMSVSSATLATRGSNQSYGALTIAYATSAGGTTTQITCPLQSRIIPGVTSIEIATSDFTPIAAGHVTSFTLNSAAATTATIVINFVPVSSSTTSTLPASQSVAFGASAFYTRFVNLAASSAGATSAGIGVPFAQSALRLPNLVSASQTTSLSAQSTANSNPNTGTNQIFWNYTLQNVELTLDLVRPSSDVQLQYLNAFKSPMGIPYPYTRTLYYYKTIPGNVNTTLDSTILPFAVRSLKGIMVIITDSYSFGYGSDSTVCNFPSKSSFMMAGLVQANLTVGGESFPLYPLKFESSYQTSHLPEMKALFNVAGIANFAPSYQPYKLRRDNRIYGLAQGGVATNTYTAGALPTYTNASGVVPPALGVVALIPGYDGANVTQSFLGQYSNPIGTTTANASQNVIISTTNNLVTPAYKDTSRFILGISTMKIDGEFLAGVDTSQSGSVALNLTFDAASSSRPYLPPRPDGTSGNSSTGRDRVVHIFGFCDAVFSVQNDSSLVRY
jgi:hypothetical protein